MFAFIFIFVLVIWLFSAAMFITAIDGGDFAHLVIGVLSFIVGLLISFVAPVDSRPDFAVTGQRIKLTDSIVVEYKYDGQYYKYTGNTIEDYNNVNNPNYIIVVEAYYNIWGDKVSHNSKFQKKN